MHGIGANLGNREWGPSPLSFLVVCPNPIHRVMVNWDPPFPLLYTCLWYNPKLYHLYYKVYNGYST